MGFGETVTTSLAITPGRLGYGNARCACCPHMPICEGLLIMRGDYPGHCFSREHEKHHVPTDAHLFPSSYPLCTHAYAVNKQSATRIVRLLRSPLMAYSLPIGESVLCI